MPLDKLISTLRTLQSDINVITVCSISLNRQVSSLLELFTTKTDAEPEDFVLRYHNFATALSTFADSLDAFERNASKLCKEEGEQDEE